MPNSLTDLSSGFMPHGFCLKWDPALLLVMIAGNIGIALAYFLIPLALRFFVGKRKDLPYPYMFKLFAAFILSCGLTHIAKVWTLYHPDYWLEASLDLWTAFVSLATAILLLPIIPKALSLRSPSELEAANAKLEAENVERKKAQEEAMKANQLKTDFVANITHEIRTPMSGIIGLAELLATDADLSEENSETSKRLLNSSKRLLGVLNDLLDFSKLESGHIKLEVAKFSLRAVLDEVIGLSRSTAEQKGLSINSTFDERLPAEVLGDEHKVRQTLLNLVHNAIKFTEQGQISVSIHLEKQEFDTVFVKFLVKDTGVGMSAESQTQLFQPFVQVEGGTRRKFGGTGLGLSISKKFVDLMGGSVGVNSKQDAGSEFWFTIPVEKTK
ncbi:MAG: hypothetical protein JST89_14885 [Cyanobacteria bacterium SZAS-4]|nr:hypothetical protein [Cyanobacteria bacterium SZAS-4]